MIDLHIHTRFSIGEYNANELIEMCTDKKIKVFSLVDNDHCLAYNDFDLSKHKNLVTGVVFTTAIDSRLINILGYEVNPTIINNFYYDKYSKIKIEKMEYRLFDNLIKIMKKNNMKLSDDIQLSLVEKGVSKKLVYYDAKKNNEDFPFLSYHNFYRDGISNPFSDYFLNESKLLPSLEEIIDIIHEAGGMAFLAHPYEYGLNVDSLIDKLIPYGIDGIEVFHTSAAVRQSLKLMKICEEHDLNASAGSDFRKSRYNIPIGVQTHHNILESNSFKWLKKYYLEDEENEA